MEISALQKARKAYAPKLPPALRGDLASISAVRGEATQSVADQDDIRSLFPVGYGSPTVSFSPGSSGVAYKALNVGVILSGGQAPGGHNVIAGLFDGLKKVSAASKLFGFLGGPSGVIDGEYIEVTAALMDDYRNTGGFDMIRSGRTKLETEEQFEKALANCRKLHLNALIVIGGDDSNTNAAVLAEYFASKNAGVQVIGCPKTIDGDLKNDLIETSFGFDTACKTYSELIGNIERDAASARKYWHFIKLMGRSASHIALECALQTHPNICIISEEVEEKRMTLTKVVDVIVSGVVKRAAKGLNFGVILIPEGLVEFIPEIKTLIGELNGLLGLNAEEFAKLTTPEERLAWPMTRLGEASRAVFAELPVGIRMQLLLDRDPHGNVQVSGIDTEKMLIEMVGARLAQLKKEGGYAGKFSGLGHFFGYEGRCAFPSNFDADYCYSLGFTAFLLVANGFTGYISSIRNTHLGADKWQAGGLPLTMMMNMEVRHGHKKPVIRKALVELDGKPFKAFASNREKWAEETCFVFPGAIQYYGPTEVCDAPTKTLTLEKS